MKEITRIHIAKVPYEIEVQAKKEIEKYIDTLEAYADDAELLQDIEIRITELLADRGIKEGGIITASDVTALREQLGEPKDFMGEGDIAIGPSDVISSEPTRKLYRDKDGAMIGGVLSGMANFFGINAAWTRILFIIILFASFGVALLIYGILWIALPPAKTAAEKLQMSGQPVTLSSIRELNESESQTVSKYEQAKVIRKVITILLGVVALVASICTAIFTVMAAIAIIRINAQEHFLPVMEWNYIVAYILSVLGGFLLTTLFALVAYAAFKREFTKRLLTAMITVVALGVLTIGTAVSLVGFAAWQTSEQVRRDTKERAVTLPANFSNIKNVTIDVSSNVAVAYVVSDKSYATLESLPTIGLPSITVNGDSAMIKMNANADVQYYGSYAYPKLTIYGPALDQLTGERGDISYRSDQGDITITAKNSSAVQLQGTYSTVKTNLDSGSFDGTGASIRAVQAELKNSASLGLGTVNSLNVTQPDVCPSDQQTYISARNITTKKIVINGEEHSATTISTDCSQIEIGNPDQDNGITTQE